MPGSLRAAHALLALALVPAAVAAQRSDEDWLRQCEEQRDRGDLVRYCDVRIEQVAAFAGPIRVDPGSNGGVSIEGWNGNGIEVHARIEARAETQAEARELAGGVRITTSRAIGAEGPANDRYSNWHVSFVVYVPFSSDLDISTNNGPISVRSVNGRMTLSSRNGPIALREVGGDVNARAQNGPISITLAGDQWRGAGLDAETRNGPITLSVPDGYNAQLETGTDNGPFTSDIPLTVTLRGRPSGPINATLGRGGAPIRAVTTNGPISIRRS